VLDLAYLDEEEATLLPRRETMLTIVFPTINVNAVAAVNLAGALNAATIGSFAGAFAGQIVTV
jgi:hypothetical protein